MGDGKRFRRGRRRTEGGTQAGGSVFGGNAKQSRSKRARTELSRRLGMEFLEERRVLATFVVTNLLDLDIDDNVEPGSLRAAIDNANDEDDADVIIFADGLAGTILLNGGQLDIEQPVSIVGPSAQKIGIQADANERIFNIEIDDDDEFRDVGISGLTLSGGNRTGGDEDDRFGGAIWNRENLSMYEVIFTDNGAGGGGAIFHEFGNLTVHRSFFGAYSFFGGNTAGGAGGGAILVGSDEHEEDIPVPSATIINSTFTGNAAGGDGGAIFLRTGQLNVANSTIFANAGNYGAGIASYGNPLPEDEEADVPAATNQTFVISSIIWGNEASGEDDLLGVAGDIDSVGTGTSTVMVDGEDEEVDFPLFPSIVSGGFNFIGTSNVPFMIDPPPPDFLMDLLIDPWQDTDMFDVDPLLTDEADLFGGAIPVFLLQADSPAIDAGDGSAVPIFSYYDGRGRHFTREFGDGVDVGAAEVQNGLFIVDLIADETDLSYSTISEFSFAGSDPYTFGDFSLREALEFSDANPEIDTITFVNFQGDLTNPDPTPSPAPTIRMTLGEFFVNSSVFIIGPTYALEIDASGNDLTPRDNDNNGSRVFTVSAPGPDFIDVTITSLTLMGGDVFGKGGGIFNTENLTLEKVTMRDNSASLFGGAIAHQFGNLTVQNSTINGNHAAADGAGLYIESIQGAAPAALVTNSTFSGNSANSRGAAIANLGGLLTVEYSTITANSAGNLQGSGILNLGAAAATEVRSSIISGNTFSDVAALSGATNTTFTSLGYNFVGSGNSAGRFNQTGDKQGTNPMLAPLAVTGGGIATHRPLPGSPIIDAGDPADLAGNPAPDTDQRGGSFVRVFDGDMNGTAVIDIGAYELQPTVLVVDNPGDIDNGDLSSGDFTLREAIALSNQNPLVDTIMFDPLLSFITMGGASSTTLTITDSVEIIGTGSSALVVQLSQVTVDQIALADKIFTIDDGKAGQIDVSISGMEIRGAQIGAILSRENLLLDDISFFVNTSNTSGGAVFHETGNFKITNSLVSGNTTNAVGADGGALYFRDVNGGRKIEMENVTIAGNFTSQLAADGGAMFIKNSTFEGRGVTVSGNSTLGGTADGGGIYVDGSNVLFEESGITGNATVGANSEGGGLFVAGAASVVTIAKSTVLALNTTIGTLSPGGGAFVQGGVLNLDNALVALNSTTGANSPGGAVAATGGSVNITTSTIEQNRTTGLNSHGGGASIVGANLLVRDSTISRNLVTNANSKGGGVYSDTNLAGTQTTVILNSTISENSAPLRGGGVFNADGRTEIRHSTISSNATPLFNTGAGVASQGNAATLTVIQSSIIAGNQGVSTGASSDVDSVDGTFTNSYQSLGYNVIGTGNSLAAFTQSGDKTGIVDPKLGPLGANGGLTETHAILANSPAINSGNPAFNPNAFSPALTTDQRGAGFARVLGGRIDAGAFESNFTAFSADFNANAQVEGFDLLAWQRGNGTASGATKAQGDANGDGAVNATDLTAWKGQFGADAGSATVGAAPSIVSGGDSSEVAAAVMAPAESSPAASETTRDLSSTVVVAGAGVPGPVSRPAFRPAVTRPALIDAAHFRLGSDSQRWAAGAAFDVNGLASAGRRFQKIAGGDAAADQAARGDEMFALLGEGAL